MPHDPHKSDAAASARDDSISGRKAGQFQSTRWSLVLLAGDSQQSDESHRALEHLCRVYWYPLYAFVRRKGHSSHDAQDLTQAFFEKLLEKDYLADADRERGRFRTFLLASLNHFLTNEWRRARAEKRGGGATVISLDEDAAEERYQEEPADHLTAERLFERRWALTLLENVLGRLRREMEEEGKGEVFEQLKEYLSTGKLELPYAMIGERLGLSEGNTRVIAHRLRNRYRELMREGIAQTVQDPGDVDDEIRHLITVLSRG